VWCAGDVCYCVIASLFCHHTIGRENLSTRQGREAEKQERKGCYQPTNELFTFHVISYLSPRLQKLNNVTPPAAVLPCALQQRSRCLPAQYPAAQEAS